jgi:transcription-repair coupling factor (superfamily II helicase)
LVFGAHGGFAALAIAELARTLPRDRRPLVVATPDDATASALVEDLRFFLADSAATGGEGGDPLAGRAVLHLPPIEASPYADVSPDRRAIQKRQSILFRLSQGLGGDVLVGSAAAMARRVVAKTVFEKACDVVVQGSTVDREALARALAGAGFERVSVVEDPGTFAVRGGVLDLYPPIYRYPVRVELDGDLVESIRLFDPSSQRTMRALGEVYFHPVREALATAGADPRARILAAADAADHPSTKTRALLEQLESGQDFFGRDALAPALHARMGSLAEYLGPESLVVLVEPSAITEALDEEEHRLRRGLDARRGEHRIALPIEDYLLVGADADALLLGARARVELRTLEVAESGSAEPPTVVRFTVERNDDITAELRRARHEKHEEILRPLAQRLREWLADGVRVVLVSPNVTHGERLVSLLRGYHFEPHLVRAHATAPDLLAPTPQPTHPEVHVGPLAHGFRLPQDGFVLFTEEEIFGARAHRKPARARTATAPGLDFRDLKPGDYVVHAEHGVGVYRGLSKLPVAGVAVDFLEIEYEGGKLFVPVHRLSIVQRYVGAEGQRPRLDRMGGVTWEKARGKVKREVQQMAEELLKLYAQRQALPGHAFPTADVLFNEFEQTFPFEETPDQQKAIDDVLGDMEAGRAMDRLVCGDVGYGKTEVALRATLKAVAGSKQVAVLAPTTVLVEQHFQTFSDRFKDFPVRVAALSRFQGPKEQAEVVKRVAEGTVDVVIGTHRLLSADVRFKDLGLLVVDEEQRFGVAHKERLKQVRTQVDTLTLTATPIPRTLHMALSGLREISIIATPPVDRLAIRTFVCLVDDLVIAEAVRKELARGGQVFFVVPRIGEGARKPGAAPRRSEDGPASIYDWADHLRAIVPEARVAVAHGQMGEEELEQAMVDFVDAKFDILVSTTIIESGLDIPRANTMFVARADCFGLAQLYQLRGRIGRSRERAFCYLIVPPESQMTADAKQRLSVLQRFTELGAGFNIASHDLEIRGAGDLLGGKQSGPIAAVGFEEYMRILEEAVAELKGEPLQRERDPEVTTDLPAFIPDDYVPDTGQRLDLYKRLASAEGEDPVREILTEIADRFGPAPPEVGLLADLMVLKSHARRLRAQSLELSETRLALALAEDTPLSPEKVLRLVNTKRSAYRLTPDMRLLRALPAEAAQSPEARLAAARAALQELLACVS